MEAEAIHYAVDGRDYSGVLVYDKAMRAPRPALRLSRGIRWGPTPRAARRITARRERIP